MPLHVSSTMCSSSGGQNWIIQHLVEHVWNVMAHAQKPDLVFHGNGRIHLNRRGSQFIRLLAAKVCASAVVMVVILDTPCSEVEWKTTGYPLHSPVSPSLPLKCVTVCHQVSTELYHHSCGWLSSAQGFFVLWHLGLLPFTLMLT